MMHNLKFEVELRRNRRPAQPGGARGRSRDQAVVIERERYCRPEIWKQEDF